MSGFDVLCLAAFAAAVVLFAGSWWLLNRVEETLDEAQDHLDRAAALNAETSGWLNGGAS